MQTDKKNLFQWSIWFLLGNALLFWLIGLNYIPTIPWLDSAYLTSHGKFLLKLMDIDRKDSIKESVDTFWQVRRILQQIEYLDKNDPIRKLVKSRVEVDAEGTLYYPNGFAGSLTLRSDDEFVKFLIHLVDEKEIQKNLTGIQHGIFVGNEFMLRDFEVKREFYRSFDEYLLAKIIKYQNDLAFNFAFVLKSGTEEQKKQLVTCAQKLGYKKEDIVSDDDIKEVIQLLTLQARKVGKLLQDALENQWKALKIKEKMPEMKESSDHSYIYFSFISYPDEREIIKQYRKLALIHHPDLGGDAEKFKVIVNEYEELKEKIRQGLPIAGLTPKKAASKESPVVSEKKYLQDPEEKKQKLVDDAYTLASTTPEKTGIHTERTLIRTQDPSRELKEKATPPEETLIEILQNSTLSPIAFTEKVRQKLHDTYTRDKTNLNPIPALINMLHALDEAYSSSLSFEKKPISRTNLKLLKEIYLRHLSEIQLCTQGLRHLIVDGKYVAKPLHEMESSQLNFVLSSPILVADTAVISLFSKSEGKSIKKAQDLINSLSKGKAIEYKKT